MCRNIKTLFNFAPPVTDEEIRAAAIQFVRKVSGFSKPSKANEPAFLAAVDQITAASKTLLDSLETNAPPKNREEEAAKARARAADALQRAEEEWLSASSEHDETACCGGWVLNCRDQLAVAFFFCGFAPVGSAGGSDPRSTDVSRPAVKV